MPIYTFNDAEAPTLLEPGEYTFTVDAVESAISSSGNAMLVLECREAQTGATLKERLVFVQKAYWKIDTFLKSCGLKIEKGTQVDVSEGLIIGKTFRATVAHRTFQRQDGTEGVTQEIDRFINPEGTPTPQPQTQQASAPKQTYLPPMTTKQPAVDEEGW